MSKSINTNHSVKSLALKPVYQKRLKGNYNPEAVIKLKSQVLQRVDRL